MRHRAHDGAPRVEGKRVVVVGGGIAGLAAATILAERGVAVDVVEREPQLGGRVRSWPVELENGDSTVMSRGFHAFFRQYYQLRALLRRADPALRGLRAVDDYPLKLADGPTDSFTNIPRIPPWNLIGFVAKSPTFKVADLGKVDVDQAMGLLDVEFPQTFHDLDGVSAAAFLDRMRFPREARHLALEVFARSFFADPNDFSAGELVAMFHTYFVGSAEGLLFDVAADDFDAALWTPLARYLDRLGVTFHTSTSVTGLDVRDDGVTVTTTAGEIQNDSVVLATDLAPLQQLVATTPELGDEEWRQSVLSLNLAPPFVVWRRWLDRLPNPGAPDFLGTSGYAGLDNVSMIHQFEDSAAAWSRQTGGSVVELHAYAVTGDPHDPELKAELARQQDRVFPELAGATQLGEEYLVKQDCSVVDLRPWGSRPTVTTPNSRVKLAGDGIRCDFPVALMERAATTGMLAANELLDGWGARGEDLWTSPMTPRFGWVRPVRRALGRVPLPAGMRPTP